MRAELAAAQAEVQERAERERELDARADALESEHAEREAELKGEIERLAAEWPQRRPRRIPRSCWRRCAPS